ncbi:MAG: hypothetical protein JNK72_18510 [Myxococcales bacterium]|nr:hypothetical protein [Myxococcales bacterium]
MNRRRGWWWPFFSAWVLLLSLWSAPGFGDPVDRHAAADDAPNTHGMQLTVPPVGAGDVRLTRGTISLSYPPALAPLVAAAVAHAEGDLAAVSQQIGSSRRARVEVRFVADADAMRAAAPRELPPPAYASGVAYPGLNLVVVATRAPGSLEPINVRQVLRHELSHIAFGEATGGAPMPRWLTEGLAVEQSAEHSFERFERLAVASFTRGIVPLSALDRSFGARSGDTVDVAYAEAADFVAWLLRKEGPARFGVMLAHAANAMPFEDAVREAYGHNLSALEGDWRSELRGRFALAPLWAGTSLLTVAGLVLTAVALVRRRRKSKAIVSRWEREERRRAEALARLERSRWLTLRPGWVVYNGGKDDQRPN